MTFPIKKQVSAILTMYEKEMVMYPYFKMIFSIEESDLHIRIKQRGQGHGLIYEELVMYYMENGMSKKDAMLKAREVVIDFFSICDRLTKRGQTPFVAIINNIDKEKVLNSNQNKDARKKETNTNSGNSNG